ncbi:MAG: MFS transporter [Halopseudomonas aestusnigri]
MMARSVTFTLFFLAVFLQAGAYGLTFMLPKLFSVFHADEKTVGMMLFITTLSTLFFVYYAGHLADKIGRVQTLSIGCLSIAVALLLYGSANSISVEIVLASILLGAGWGLTYSLIPIALTTIVEDHERVRYFSLYSVFLMAGFGLSPVMASFLEGQGFVIAESFYIIAIFCFLSAFIFFILSGPVKNLAVNPKANPKSSLTLGAIKSILNTKALLPIVMVWLGASVFAGMNNFQSVFAEERGLNYSDFFLYYTITVVICRVLLAKFKGGNNPYAIIATLQYIMCGSVILFIVSGASQELYALVAVLFGIGYGASYPVLAAMAANDAEPDLLPQTLQVFAFTYFIGIFGFPLIAGWFIVEISITSLLILVAALAAIEATLAMRRAVTQKKSLVVKPSV